MAKILVVDDEKDIRFLIREVLSDEGHTVVEAAHSDAALAELNKDSFDLAILDIWLENSDLDGMELLQKLKKDKPSLQVLMVSGHGTVEMAVKAIQLGAYDFLEKPFGSDRLILQVNRALEAVQLTAENKNLRQLTSTGGAWVGKAPASLAVAKTLEKLAGSESRVMVLGEKGTGKNLVARLLANGHALDVWQPNAEVPESGIALIENAEKLDREAQANLLKQLTSGGKKARLITLALPVLEKLCQTGAFSKDLYERLAVAKIELPPLKKRLEDMAELCAALKPDMHFSLDVFDALKTHIWPGNTRELKLVLDLAALRAQAENRTTLEPHDICLTGASGAATGSVTPNGHEFALPLELDLRAAREEFERAYLGAQMRRLDNNVSAVAKQVGMDRAALHRKLKTLEGGTTDTEEDNTHEAA